MMFRGALVRLAAQYFLLLVLILGFFNLLVYFTVSEALNARVDQDLQGSIRLARSSLTVTGDTISANSLVLANPKRMTKETKPLRLLSIGRVLLIVLANTVALALLVDQLVHSHTKQVGPVAARRRAGLGHQHDRLRVGVLGARPRRARHAHPRPAPTAAAG